MRDNTQLLSSGPAPCGHLPGDLRGRLQAARAALAHCTLCQRRCGADRLAGRPPLPPCNLSSETFCLRRYVSYAEDSDLVPALRVYLGGCNFRCRFCNTAPAGFEGGGSLIAPEELAMELLRLTGSDEAPPGAGADLTERRAPNSPVVRRACPSAGFDTRGPAETARAAGGADRVRSIDFLGGEPSLHPHAILAVAAAAGRPLPIVLDTNLYMTPLCLDLLDGVVQVYLANLKFGNDRCAKDLAGVDRYFEAVTGNLGVLVPRGRTRVRYLLVPGHVECCLVPMVRWLSDHLPGSSFHLMTSYVPCWRAVSDPAIGRLNTPGEIAAARAVLAASSLKWRVDGDAA